jgi:hypothetical protein
MSRLTEIIDNHEQIDDLFALLKHYGVNAQFVAESLIESFEQIAPEAKEDDAEDEAEGQTNLYPELLDDLKQYMSRF